MVTTYSYDRVQRLTDLTNARAGATITSHAYTLDNEGDRTALSEFVSGITPAGTTDGFTMGYDGLLRLTAVAVTNPEGFTLDGASNVTARTGPAATFSYDQANRLTSDGTSAYTWSAADRLVQRGADTFTYDALDRLTGSTVAGTPRTYAYDGDGLLHSRSAPLPTTFLWDPATSPARLLQVGSDRLVYGLGPLYIAKVDGTTATFARDGGKSVRAEVNDLGLVTGSYRYRAYGALAQSSGLGPSVLGYAGQLTDPSGLVYMRARWYDPQAGRFLSRDLVLGDSAIPRSLNAYGYAFANPLTLSDPSGTCPFCDRLPSLLMREANEAVAATRSTNPWIALTGYVEVAAALALGGAITVAVLGPELAIGGGIAAQKAHERAIVIGESGATNRVATAAAKLNAEYYQSAAKLPTQSENVQANLEWLYSRVQAGYKVLDIGPAGDTARSVYYNAETALLDAMNYYSSWMTVAP